MPYVDKLTSEDQSELQGLIQVFLAEKRFEGCAGLEITDEIRLTIAAQACVLLLHRETDFYPKLQSILVYPHAYVATGRHRDDEHIVTEGPEARLGESSARVLGEEYTALLDDLKHHRRTLIDSYGATNPAEFFAVVTELFFEKPHQLKERHPALYEQLRGFYQQDPAR